MASIVEIRYPQPDIAVVCMDTPNRPGNVLDDQLFGELDSAIEELSANDNLSGVILISAKPKIFVAGADLNRIQQTADFTDEQIIEFCEQGRAVMKKFSAASFPSVAAIHGAAVGGGLEIAMWCDFRIATDHRATKLGLPEVKLGLVPGWAGTSRLPRLTNLKDSIELVTSGDLVSAKRGHEIGLIDEIVQCENPSDAQATLEVQAIQLLQKIDGETWRQRRETLAGPVSDCSEIESIVANTGRSIVANRDIFLFAPTVVLEHMTRTAPLAASEAESSESIAMAQVYGSPANRGLLHHYFLVRHNHKQPGLVDTTLESKPVKSVGIIGAGLMGASIANKCAAMGIGVRLLDAHPEAAKNAAKSINESTSAERVVAIEKYDGLAGVDLVIESVVETINVKKSVLQKIEASENAPRWVASNTSAIEIGAMAKHIEHRDSFCGIHFCHPKLMSIVEVICGPDTDEQTIADAVSFVRQLRMMPVAINDCPGFVVNRLLAAMINQALQLYSEGHAIESIDTAMRDFGFLGGPFEIIDVIGADTCMYAGRSMWENGLKCVSLSPILPRMVKKNLLGRKVGKGFYEYDSPEGDGKFNQSVNELLKDYRVSPGSENASDTIVMRIVAWMALEASLILEEEIVNDPKDIDLCVIHGLSFPAHQGGILFWADQVGIDSVVRLVGDQASEMLKKMNANGQSFHG